MAFNWKALLNPVTIHKLQKATRLGDFAIFKKYSEVINNQSKELYTLRN